jgi:hypothetical protein
MDLAHARKSAHRFHQATTALAARAMGLDVERVIRDGYSLPLVVQENGAIYVLNMGTQRQEYDFITPYVVNGAFSLELHLKLLGFLESKIWSKKHTLDELFETLSPESRVAINTAVGGSLSGSQFLRGALSLLKSKGVVIEWNTKNLLKRSADAYVNWRYAFESTPGCFAGYSEIQSAIAQQISKLS